MASTMNLVIKASTTQAQGALNDLGDAEKGVSKRTKMLAGAFTALAGATAYAMKQAINYGDYLEKTAQKIGVGTEALSAYKLGAELAGTSQEKLVSGLQRLQKGMGEAMMTPTSRTAKAFEALGLSITDQEGKLRNVEDLLVDFSEVMSKLPDGTAKTAIAMDLMGRSGAELIPFLNQGTEGLEGMREEAERLGIVWDEEASDSAAHFNDELTTLSYTMTGWIQTATRYWLPSLEGIAKGINTVVRDLQGATDQSIQEDFAKGQMRETIKAQEEVLRNAKDNYETNLQMWKEMNEGKEYVETEYHKVLRENLEKEKKLYTNLFNELGRDAGLVTSEMQSEIDDMEKLQEKILKLEAYKAPEKEEKKRTAGAKRKTPEEKAKEDAEKAAKVQRAADQRALKAFQDHLRSETQALKDELHERYALIKRNLDNEDISRGEALALAKAAQSEYNAEIKLLRDELDEDERRRAQEKSDRLAETNAEELQRSSEMFNAQSQLANVAIGATEQFATMMVDAVSATHKEGTKEQKAAAKAGFVISKAAGLAQAAVSMAVAMNNGLATQPFLPLGPIMMATAGILGAANIATIMASTIKGVADAGLPPGALRAAGLNNHTTIAVRNDEMVLDPVGTRAISEMLQNRAANSPVNVNTTLEIDGNVLGQTVDSHLIRSQERGLAYTDRTRYGAR